MSNLPSKPSSIACCPSSSAKISASAPEVYTTLLDTSTWPSWNHFVPSCTITSQPDAAAAQSLQLQVGTRMTFHCVLVPAVQSVKFPQHFVVTEISEQQGSYVVRWANAGVPEWLMRTDRVHVIRPVGEGECEVATWDAMEGPFAWIVRLTVGGLVQRGVERWIEGLKGRFEKGK